jgi:excisionase family DNA binding protein
MARHNDRPADDLPGIDPLLSLASCGAALGISTTTVQRLVAQQKLRVIRITSRRIGVRRSELQRYIAAQECLA